MCGENKAQIEIKLASNNHNPKESNEEPVLLLKIPGAKVVFASFYSSAVLNKTALALSGLSQKEKDFLISQHINIELRNRTFLLRCDSNPDTIRLWLNTKREIAIGNIKLEIQTGLIRTK